MTRPLRILFFKKSLEWPRQSGHDVHSFNMMRALGSQGHAVGLATLRPLGAGALQDFVPEWQGVVDGVPGRIDGTRLRPLQERFRSYWGVGLDRIAALHRAAAEFRANTIVAAGMDVLPYYPALSDFVRVWYPGDDLARQYLMWLRPATPSTWVHLKQVALMTTYERAFASEVDRVWAVSASEARAFRRFGGFSTIDVLPNGVDADDFGPRSCDPIADSAVFWGRLDFEPNIQAIEWFARRVWPLVTAARPAARLTIIGFHPSARVLALRDLAGVEILADLPDLKTEVCRRSLTVLPFLSGGGIKNKLLEAAALARPIVCSPQAIEGLTDASLAPLEVARTPAAWQRAILALWDDEQRRQDMGARARAWVLEHHGWDSVARRGATAIEASLERRDPK